MVVIKRIEIPIKEGDSAPITLIKGFPVPGSVRVVSTAPGQSKVVFDTKVDDRMTSAETCIFRQLLVGKVYPLDGAVAGAVLGEFTWNQQTWVLLGSCYAG